MKIVGIDLGGTHLRIRLCSENGVALGESREKVLANGVTEVVLQIKRMVNSLYAVLELQIEPFIFSVALAGMLDKEGRMVCNAPNLGWQNVPFAELLETALPSSQQVFLWNDLDAATWGEFSSGSGQSVENLATVFVGSGVGGGLVLKGRLHQGAWNVAGEIGHIKVIEKGGRFCGCGGYGCVEAYTGGHHLAKIAQEYAKEGKSDYLKAQAEEIGLKNLTASDLAKGQRLKDSGCLDIFEQTTRYLGWAVSHLVTLINPELLIFGGGVLLNWPELYHAVQENIHERVTTPASKGLVISTALLGDDAGLTGAIALAQQKQSAFSE